MRSNATNLGVFPVQRRRGVNAWPNVGIKASSKRPAIDSSEMESSADDGPSSAMTLTLVDISESGVDTQAARAAARLPDYPRLQSIAVPTPEPNFSFQQDEDADARHDAPSESNQSDPGRQLLFGRYIGQITARIERAWMRPRTPIDSTFFACRVQITQERNGVVQEIELVRCNGNSRWQTSLVQAIQSASPLPAPPAADVFAKRLTLDLHSATFTAGDMADGFEPQARAIATGQLVGK